MSFHKRSHTVHIVSNPWFEAMSWGSVRHRLFSRWAAMLRSGGELSAALDSALPKAGTDDGSLVQRMLAQGRYTLLLRPQIVRELDPQQRALAEQAFFQAMSAVTEGNVVLAACRSDDLDAAPETVEAAARSVYVESLYLDRYPVTNRQFHTFVEQGGYRQQSLWQPDFWPRVGELVDRSGRAGPRHWSDGHFPTGRDEHPVVGVCWLEAQAYARWVGKRLPTDAEWVKAACWPVNANGGPPAQRKYPWGETVDGRRANLWATQLGATVAVTDFPEGASAGGVHQLIGNVWEWTASNFSLADGDCELALERPLKSLRGGAFDTYFESHATCQFQSGDSPLARKHNIGLRCAISRCDLALPDDPPAAGGDRPGPRAEVPA